MATRDGFKCKERHITSMGEGGVSKRSPEGFSWKREGTATPSVGGVRFMFTFIMASRYPAWLPFSLTLLLRRGF